MLAPEKEWRMPVSAELSQLIELQELDLDIQRLTDRLSKIPVERDNIEKEFETHAAEFLAVKSKYEQTLIDRSQIESDLASAQEHHDKYKQDLMRVRNEKEYTTALREIDAAKKQISAYETEILKRMEELEKLEAEIKASEPDIERKRGEVDTLLATLNQEIEETNQTVASLRERRASLVSTISQDMLSTYERMARTRRGQALSAVRDGICSACRVKVRPKIFSDVRKGDILVTCESCGRILYYRPDTSQSVEAGTK
jgi:predicted  nucleic acid-binding Zn-ribbon protein